MRFKSITRQLHLFLGLASGLVIFIVALTGSIYAFEKEFRAILHKDLYEIHSAAGTRLPLDTLISRVKGSAGKIPIKTIVIPAEKNKTLQFNLKNKRTLFVNPYSAVITGDLDMETEFFAVVLKIHRSLCLDDFGKIITGFSAAIFLIMLGSGIYLWWPTAKRNLAQKLKIKREAGKKRFFYDLHSVLGFYASWVLVFTALTGLIFAFKPVEGFMFYLTGSKKEMSKPQSEKIEGMKKVSPGLVYSDALSNYQDHNCILVFPDDPKGCYRLTVNLEEKGFYKKSDHFFFDQYSGRLVKRKLFEQQNTGEKLRSTNLDIHTGKVLGFFGQCLVFLAGIVAASLPVTGFWLWNSKRKKRKKSGAIKAEVFETAQII